MNRLRNQTPREEDTPRTKQMKEVRKKRLEYFGSLQDPDTPQMTNRLVHILIKQILSRFTITHVKMFLAC